MDITWELLCSAELRSPPHSCQIRICIFTQVPERLRCTQRCGFERLTILMCVLNIPIVDGGRQELHQPRRIQVEFKENTQFIAQEQTALNAT